MNIIEKEIERLSKLSAEEAIETEKFLNNVQSFTDWASKPDSHCNENGEEEKICNIIFTFRENNGILKDSFDMMMSGENAFTQENEALLKNLVGVLAISAGSVIRIASEREKSLLKEREEIESIIKDGKED